MIRTARPPWPLLIETGLAMIVASAAIRLLPFRRLAGWMGQGAVAASPAEPDDIAIIARAIKAWSTRLPWRTMCFEQGLTAHWMLRRRGLASTLYYGAATLEGQLKAHVWVRSGELDVVGCEIAADYALLARFPFSMK
jgi:hypothetical protein